MTANGFHLFFCSMAEQLYEQNNYNHLMILDALDLWSPSLGIKNLTSFSLIGRIALNTLKYSYLVCLAVLGGWGSPPFSIFGQFYSILYSGQLIFLDVLLTDKWNDKITHRPSTALARFYNAHGRPGCPDMIKHSHHAELKKIPKGVNHSTV